MGIKLIIFDIGGVLMVSDKGFDALFSELAKSYNSSLENFQSAFFKYFTEYHFDRTLSQYKFWERVLSEFKDSPSEEEIHYVIDLLNENVLTRTNSGMLELVRELSKNYKLVALSSSFREMDKAVFSSDFVRYLDRLCLSHLNSPKKPKRKAFQPIFDDFNVKPEECVFIDDKLKHIEGAKKHGINCILFTSVEDLKKKLKDLNVNIN